MKYFTYQCNLCNQVITTPLSGLGYTIHPDSAMLWHGVEANIGADECLIHICRECANTIHKAEHQRLDKQTGGKS